MRFSPSCGCCGEEDDGDPLICCGAVANDEMIVEMADWTELIREGYPTDAFKDHVVIDMTPLNGTHTLVSEPHPGVPYTCAWSKVFSTTLSETDRLGVHVVTERDLDIELFLTDNRDIPSDGVEIIAGMSHFVRYLYVRCYSPNVYAQIVPDYRFDFVSWIVIENFAKKCTNHLDVSLTDLKVYLNPSLQIFGNVIGSLYTPPTTPTFLVSST